LRAGRKKVARLCAAGEWRCFGHDAGAVGEVTRLLAEVLINVSIVALFAGY